MNFISTDEDPSLRIESSAIINLRGVSTKLNKYEDPSLRIESSAIINLRGVSTKLNKYNYI